MKIVLRRYRWVFVGLLPEPEFCQKRLIAKGLRETEPVISNATKVERALNRRVEFSILKK